MGAFGAVGALGADVLGLQEVETRTARTWFLDQSKISAKRAGLEHFRFSQTRRMGFAGAFGNVVASRWPISDFDKVWLPRKRREPRCAQIATIEHPDGPFVFANTHLHNKASVAAAQLGSLLGETLSEEALGADRPLVIVGDMNMVADVAAPIFERFGVQVIETGPTFPALDPVKRFDWIGVRNLEFESTGGELSCGGTSDHCALSAHIVYN